MYEKLKRLIGWIQKGEANPYAIDINPTYRCNLRCTFCNGYNEGVTQKRLKEISDEKFLGIANEAINIGIKEFHIAGDGEPLLKKKLFLNLVTIIKNKGLHGKVTTNGTLFDRRLMKNMIALQWDIINISLLGSQRRMHDNLVGREGAFRKCVTAINLFNNNTKKYPKLKITTVITNKNFYDLKNIVKLAAKLKIHHVHFEPLTICEKNIQKMQITPTQKKQAGIVFEEVSSTAKRHLIYTNIDTLKDAYKIKQAHEKSAISKSSNKKEFNPACFQPWYKMVIRPNGHVQPCCNFYDPIAENIADKSLKEIWYGPYFTMIREKLMQQKFFEYCSRCNAWIGEENKRLKDLIHQRRFILNSYLHLSKFGNKYLPDVIKDCLKIMLYKKYA